MTICFRWELIFGLINAYKLLPVNGHIIVVTFHSLEDRIVKFFFKNYSEDKKISRYLPSTKNENKIFEILNKKAIIPSTEEIKKNPEQYFWFHKKWDRKLYN